jgi:hypothetical protein
MTEPKYIHFHNNTSLPIIIDSWIDGTNRIESVIIGANEKRIIHSSVGEWHLQSMFRTKKERQMWTDAGLDDMLVIGKIRSTPCQSGNYSWMEYYKPFDCVYSKLEVPENNVSGLMTFSLQGVLQNK